MGARGNTWRWRAGIGCALLLVCALGLAACGSHHARSGGLQAADSTFTDSMGSLEVYQPDGLAAPPAALAELDALACPEGVDAGLWGELKGALEKALKESGSAGVPPVIKADGGRDARPTKSISTPPIGEANRVNDLSITDNGDGTFTLSWHYRNLGDYDQDGVVALEDIIPLAEHFGEAVPETDTERNSLQAVIDGSGNGRVGIEDVTPIAQNFQRDVARYMIEGADSEEGPWEAVGEVAQDAGNGEGRLEYSSVISSPAALWHRVVPYDAEGNPGEPSNAVLRPSNEPIIYSISPISGYQHEEYTFAATVSGVEPLTYVWDFGGGASPNTSSEASPTITLSDAGEYAAFLTVTNAYGSADFPFTLTILERDTWAHTWGGPRFDGTVDLAIDEDGNIYVVSYTSSFGPLGQDDMLLLKYASDGEVLWAKTWGTPETDHVDGCALVDGGLLVVGYAYGIGAGARDLFFLKYDLDGNLLWARTWGTPDYERANAITVDPQDNVYVVGDWTFYGGLPDVLVAKFTSEGSCIWAKRWDGGPREYAYGVALTASSQVLVGGSVANAVDGPDDALLLAYSGAGELVSVKCWDAGESEGLGGLLVTPSGDIYASGGTFIPSTSDYLPMMLGFNPALEVVWARSVPTSSSLVADLQGNLYASGYRIEDSGEYYGMLFKYDLAGNVASGWRTTGSWGRLGAIAFNADGDFFVTGSAGSNAGALEILLEQSHPTELSSVSRQGIERDLTGIEGVVEGVETSPEGVIDTGAGSTDVLVLKNVN